ncbi:HTH_Tnp_Tc3_2 domain-containing protein [Trichonephila clavipes]|nr:HTH_Tnp_Tc3_2 domain-containing protein [Trichonephila clavipes]
MACRGKLPDLDTFDREQIVGARRRGHSISEIVRQLGFSRSTVSRVYQEYMYSGQKISDRANFKGQFVSRTVSKRTVKHSLHRMGFGSRRSTRVPLLNARHQAGHLA